MADRRMFSKTIIDSDAFLDLSLSTQAVYFHLAMRADDEGFLNNPKRIMRTIGADEKDLQVLIDKDFILPFDESGVIVVKHWRMHNYIRKDRIQETSFKAERKMLELDENGVYKKVDDMSTKCQPSDGHDCAECPHRLGNNRLGNNRLGNNSLGKDRVEHNRLVKCDDGQSGTVDNVDNSNKMLVLGELGKVRLSEDQMRELEKRYGSQVIKAYIDKFENHIEKYGLNYSNHFLEILKWLQEDMPNA